MFDSAGSAVSKHVATPRSVGTAVMGAPTVAVVELGIDMAVCDRDVVAAGSDAVAAGSDVVAAGDGVVAAGDGVVATAAAEV